MKNKKGLSIIDVIFSMGIVVLVLTGVIILIVNTASARRAAYERQKAVEFSQLLIETKVLEIKNDPVNFWNNLSNLSDQENKNAESINSNFSGYLYNVEYKNCVTSNCTIIFTVKWGDSQELKVERLFLRKGV